MARRRERAYDLLLNRQQRRKREAARRVNEAGAETGLELADNAVPVVDSLPEPAKVQDEATTVNAEMGDAVEADLTADDPDQHVPHLSPAAAMDGPREG